jgi:hypothetical protein
VIQAVNQRLNAVDPTRPVYCQYTKPVSELSGLSQSQAAAYVNADCGIVSFDAYIISDSDAPNNDLWRQYDDVEQVRSLANDNTPVWPFIEAGEPFTSSSCSSGQNQWSGITPTPAMEVAEGWNAIIGGARGIQWFDHDFGCGAGGYPESSDDLIDPSPAFSQLQSTVKQFDNQVENLAPILNSPFANGYITSATNPNPDTEDHRSVNYSVKYNATNNNFDIFIAPTTDTPETVTLNTAGNYTGTISDTEPISNTTNTATDTNGQITINFTGQTDIHRLTIPNSGS